MAQFGKFEITRTDAAGNPVSGATIVLRKQGSTVVSGGPTAYTVDDPGGLVTGDTVNVYNSDGTDPSSASLGVTVNSATSLTIGGGGFSASNNDRISPSTNRPTMYKDANGDETTASLTTDTNGYASAWVEFQALDVVSTGGSSALGAAATRVWFDVYPSGIERSLSTAYMTGSTVVRRYNTLRALTSGDKFVEYRSAGTLKWYVDVDGSLNPRVPAHSVAGALTVTTGGITVTGNSTITGTLTGLTGFTVASGTISLPAGSLETADLAANAVSATAVDDDTVDYTITGTYVAIPNVSASLNVTSTASEVVIIATVPVENSTAASSTIQARLYEDGTTILHEGYAITPATSGDGSIITLMSRRTGLTVASHAYTVQIKQTSGAPVIKNSTDRKARIIVIEHKK